MRCWRATCRSCRRSSSLARSCSSPSIWSSTSLTPPSTLVLGLHGMGEALSPAAKADSAASTAPHRRVRHPGTVQVLATGIPLLLLAAAAVAAPWLPIPDAGAIALGSSLSPPVWADGGGWDHVLGTDQLGRDLGARLFWGARLTLLIAFSSTILGAIV